MNQTTDYQLNQWEKTDRIMMDDFNRDNARLETALAALRDKMAWESVKDIVTEAAASQFVIDLSDVDLKRYACMFLSLDGNSASVQFTLSMGKITDNSNYSQGAFLVGTEKTTYLALLAAVYPQRVLMLTGGTDDSHLMTFSLHSLNALIGLCNLPCSQITKLTLNGYGSVPPGLHIKLVGVKI